MNSRSHSDPQDLRHVAQQIVERLQTEPAFRHQVQNNPVDTLLAAGLPERALPDFLREMNLPADVVGYDFDAETCTITCITTDLPDKGLPGHHGHDPKPL